MLEVVYARCFGNVCSLFWVLLPHELLAVQNIYWKNKENLASSSWCVGLIRALDQVHELWSSCGRCPESLPQGGHWAHEHNLQISHQLKRVSRSHSLWHTIISRVRLEVGRQLIIGILSVNYETWYYTMVLETQHQKNATPAGTCKIVLIFSITILNGE